MKNQKLMSWLLTGLFLLFCATGSTFSQTSDCINVKEPPYNAKGDGTSRDAKKIQNAINAGGCIFFPNGTYNISDTTIDIPSPRTLIFETDNAVLKYTGNGAAVKIGNEKFITWHRGRIDIASAGNNAVGLHIRGLWNADFFGIRIDRKSSASHSQVGIKIETSETGGNNWGAYIINFYKPILAALTTGNGHGGTAAIQTLRTTGTTSDSVNVTHLGIYGGWITRGTDVFRIRNLSNGFFENIASEVTNAGDGDIYDIDNSNDILVIPGELPVTLQAGAYDFNLGTQSHAVTILTQHVRRDVRIDTSAVKSRPSIISRSHVELYGSRADSIYYTRLSSDYNYGSSMKLVARGGGANEATLLEWGDAAGLTLRGGVIGVKIGDQGTAIKKHLSGTTTWDPPSIAVGAVTSTTVTVSGANIGDTVTAGFSQAVPAGAMLFGAVTAANIVTVTLYNRTAGSLNLASGTLRADVWQH